ncbi:response regulator transcription factor [Flavobacterium sedimenticola]|uniref:Response regulator transcription factor n=1 Tax=Flavobacterium sedimenticola TaxID=3043286 RepID=A0ABT6XS55_9FLAO|nr:response regulator transcription factor [Flavobacterium sedimenticola]MDI9257886.1 response regulator transcription factor [Flavobacterium sedimenticola]
MKKKHKIAILDDHPLIVEGLKILLSNSDELVIVGGFNSSDELFSFDGLDTIDILLLDVFFKDDNGIDICLKVKKKYPWIIILGMSSQSERSIILQMLKNGASGYLLKSAGVNEFVYCINNALKGSIVFSKEVESLMNKTTFSDLKTIPRLTKREKEILKLLIEGKSTQEISDILFLSFLTTQTHRRNLLNKFQVKNVAELVNFALKNGLI